ncbi:TIR domain-containing protein [Luteolibacter ambystomatis]|uniref:TIR domain-containing protein n=1 Tax=Luteolibacter ambystomatis TaxID=2824561 RepID=A0A975J1H1_9BACT|nr:TIR domain-containing protein [Luteolibacter ambystomatis]QUE52290.1 TIR domain-containing protein [Luteolibacter ambystomatis]
MKPPPQGLSPVRIYVLWHPEFDAQADAAGSNQSSESGKSAPRGLTIARRLYHWFRLENMEGIPVYFRSAAGEQPDGSPLKSPPPISEDCRINYIIPLIDANMVASPEWRRYVAELAAKHGASGGCTTRVFPVAVDPVAYNMPESMRKLNFIRHDMRQPSEVADMKLIAKLTEVLCRDMRFYLQQQSAGGRMQQVPGKLKIFLSHAKADDTREAVKLKEFIQGETQCEAFFDETDIASGYDYEEVLKKAITEDSAGLIVVQGDHYADRPWCRKEIRDFLQPVPDPLVKRRRNRMFIIPPVVVVQTMQGKQIARTIPELGHAPCVRWQDDSPRFVVTTLLREILLGMFYRLIGIGLANRGGGAECVVINRTPDPVMVNRLISFPQKKSPADHGGATIEKIIHPGYGLSLMERQGLEMAFPKVKFYSYSELSIVSPAGGGCLEDVGSLDGKVFSVSVGDASDALVNGMGDEHNQELLLRLLRPLLRKRSSVLYGGAVPCAHVSSEPWKERVNFTGVILHLLLSERSADKSGKGPGTRLFNLSAGLSSRAITRQVIAQWTDVCSFIPVDEKTAGLEPIPPVPKPDSRMGSEELTLGEKRKIKKEDLARMEKYQRIKLATNAACLTVMRRTACMSMPCVLPDKPVGRSQNLKVKTFAHLFLGGKILGYSGIIPGVFEEMLHAFEAGKPVFVIGESRGASGLVARWLAYPPKSRPPELTVDYYLKETSPGDESCNERFKIIREGLQAMTYPGKLTPDEALDRLWSFIRNANSQKKVAELLRNGLNGSQNHRLLTSGSSKEICPLVWTGINELTKSSGNSNAVARKTVPRKRSPGGR